MEREQKYLERFSTQYRFHKEQNKKHARQYAALKQKIEGILKATVDYSMEEFEFLTDTVELCKQAREALMYSCAYRYYLMGQNRQIYFDKIIVELETALDHIVTMADPNWFFYLQYKDGIPIMRDNFCSYKERVEDARDDFVKVFTEFMPRVKSGMPDLPPDSIVPTTNSSIPIDQQEEIEMSPETAIVRTEHSHEAGQEVRENLVKPG